MTLLQQITEMINADHGGHPSRKTEQRVITLESVVLELARKIDILSKVSEKKPEAENKELVKSQLSYHEKHFVLLETAQDCESPMIGTLSRVYPDSTIDTMARAKSALEEHFDAEVKLITDFPDLFDGGVVWGIVVDVNGLKYGIQILETWMY